MPIFPHKAGLIEGSPRPPPDIQGQLVTHRIRRSLKFQHFAENQPQVPPSRSRERSSHVRTASGKEARPRGCRASQGCPFQPRHPLGLSTVPAPGSGAGGWRRRASAGGTGRKASPPTSQRPSAGARHPVWFRGLAHSARGCQMQRASSGLAAPVPGPHPEHKEQ